MSRKFMFHRVVAALPVALLVWVSACAEKDTSAPPAPNLDPVVSPTSLATQTLTGSAEFGALVKISGGKADVETRADPFTARFRVEVELSLNASNALTLTATDAAGNTSPAATATIAQQPVKPDELALSAQPSPVSADDGALVATAKISQFEKGVDLSNVSITFSIDGLAGVAPQTLKTNAAGIVTATFSGLKTAGVGSLKAIADVNSLFKVVPITVLAGRPAQVTLKLFKNAETVELNDPVTINVGDRLRTEARAVDLNGNAVDVPLLISTNLPGALLQGKDLTNLQKSGSYTIVATAANTTLFAARQVLVLPGNPVKVSLGFTVAEARAGETVGIIASALDAFGNEIPNQPIDFTVSPTLAASFTIPGTNPAQVKQQGILTGTRTFVAYDLTGVAGTANAYTVTATATGITPTLAASNKLVVRPAPGSAFGCRAFTGATCTNPKLEFLPATSPPTTTKTVAAGTDVDFQYTVVDLYGNVTTGPVTVFTSAPGALVLDDGVTGTGKLTRLTSNGAFSVNFYLAGVGQKGQLSLNVGTGPVGSLSLVAAGTLVGPNTDVKLFARVLDAFGNPISCSGATVNEVAFTGTGSAGGAVAQKGATTCFNGAFQAVYTFALEDLNSVEAEYRPGGVASGVKAVVFVNVLKFDNSPPVVSVPQAQLLRNGTPCVFSGAPAACVVAPGDFLEFVVTANDNSALSQIAFTAFFSTAGANGTLQTRTVFVPNNAALPINQPFSFNVPGGAFLEDVPLTALAVDGSGNIATSTQLLLRLTVATFKQRSATLVLRNLGGNVVNSPEDVSVAPNGDVFVANAGNSNVLRLAAGATFPQVYAPAGSFPGGFRPGFMQRDASGNLYLSDRGGSATLARLDTAASPARVDYVAYTNGGTIRGLSQSPPAVSKGVVGFAAAPLAGDRVQVGAVDYQVVFPPFVSCTAPTVCLNFSAAPTATQAATALRDCLNAPALPLCSAGFGGAVATAHGQVSATLFTTSAPPSVVVAIDTAKAPSLTGSAGNVVAFGTTACLRITLNGAACVAPPTTLVEGHGPTLFAGQEGGGGPVDTVFRFPFTYTTPFPKDPVVTNEGAFSMTVGGNNHEQWGLAVKDLTTSSTRNVRDLVFYFPDVTVGTDRLRAARFTNNGPSLPVFSVPGGAGRTACGDCIRDTSDPATPQRTFNALWDVVLEPLATVTPMVAPNGCLLVSDDGDGSVYSVDTRDPLAPNPLVSLVATGLPGPRGLAFGPTGDLFVALQGGNAVIRIGPSPDPTDCF